MNKQAFISALRTKLSGLPSKELEDRLNFYMEMIDDRVEEGLTEEAAISEIGSVEEIAEQIIAEIPLTKIVKEKIRPKKKRKAWEIVLLAVGSPLWAPLLLAAVIVILALYIVLWALIISIWAVFAALVACGGGGILIGAAHFFTGHPASGSFLISASLLSAGLSIFLFFGCLAATKGTLLLTKKILLKIKNSFVGKEKHHV